MKSIKFYRKFFNIIVCLSLVLQSFAPIFAIQPAYAQEVTPPAVEDTTPAPEPASDAASQPAVEATPEVTEAPAPEVTAEPTVAPEVTSAPEETTNENAQPTGPPAFDAAPPAEEEESVLSATIIEDVETPAVDLSSPTDTQSASLATDKPDYAPTDTALITGNGLTPNKTYSLTVSSTDDPATSTTVNVTTDENGSFTYAYQLDGIFRPNYSVVVKDGDEIVATTTFTDAFTISVGIYDQCSNDDGDGYATGDTGCRWTNGNIQANNSTYHEGDATVQRVLLKDLKEGTHTVGFRYNTTKNGKHAYDYLTDDNFSELAPNPLSNADLCDGASAQNLPSCASITPTSSAIIPTDPNAGGFDVAQANRHFKIRNGTITGVSVPTISSGTYAGTSETDITVTFTVDTVGTPGSTACYDRYQVQNTDVCAVLISFGAHISDGDDWGAGTTAVNISGSPYHVALNGADGTSTGGKDNQMQADAIVVPQQATLTLQKTVVNDNGGTALDTAWTLSANGPTPISGVEGNAAVTNALVDAGTYDLSESAGPAGYTNGTTWVCTGVTQDDANTLTLAPNDAAVCTITNNDNAPQLHLRKTITNDNGGTAAATDWTLTATGTGGTPTNLSGSTPVDSGVTFKADTYALGESGPSGYTAGAWNCGGATMPDATHVTVPFGGNVTCTINNNDNAAHLIVIKDVINDDGGTAEAEDFTMNVTATDPSDASFPGEEDPGTAITLDAGDYSVDEDAHPGYTKTVGTNCSGTIALGETKSCTITNNDNAPKLKLVKEVANDNGGGADANDWVLNAAAEAPKDGRNFFNDGGSGTSQTVFANAGYLLSETGGPTGYDPSSWSCNGGNLVGDTITLVLGADVTCTITNDDQTAHLTLLKTVVTDNGGTAEDTDWTLKADGPTNISGVEGNAAVTNAAVNAGSYTLSELGGPDGYSASQYSCVKNVGAPVVSNSITLGLGDNAVCTITNNDIAPTLKVIKQILPDTDEGLFDLQIDGVTEKQDASDGDDTGAVEVTANEIYTVSEVAGTNTELSHYTAVIDGDCAADGTITLALDEDAVCTITNTRKGHITIEKQTLPNGNETEFEFTGDVAGTLGDGDTETEEVVPGTYDSTETVPAGWALTDITCDDDDSTGNTDTGVATFNVGAGENVTCTFTNNKPAAQIDVTPLTAANKVGDDHVISANVQVQNGNGTWGPAADGTVITFSITNSNGATAVFVPASPDTCTTTAGACTITINSPTSGHVVVNASASPTVLGISLPVSTGTGGDNSADAVKDYVNARISISPLTDTNPVNQEHTFTVLVEKSVVDGVWTAVENAEVDVVVTPNPTSLVETDCNNGTDIDGECTATMNSSVTGAFTAIARSKITVGGVEFKLQTNGQGENSDPAHKTYVNAKINIGPASATNQVNEEHDFTITVLKDTGDGNGFVAAANSLVDVVVTPEPDGGLTETDCNDGTNGSGVCTATINSSVPGVFTAIARTQIVVGGVTFRLQTNGQNGSSGPAVKTYEGGKIIVEKVTDPSGDEATFDFTADYDNDGFTLSDGDSNDSGFIPTGEHNVSETVPTGWDLTSVTCDDQSPVDAISLQDGETVTCTFTNTKRGSITVLKDATPNDCQDFSFSMTGQSNFPLDDNDGVVDCLDTNQPQSKAFNNLVPDDYTITETLPNSFWELDSVACVLTGTQDPYTDVASTTNGVVVTLNPGADVTCTFVNNKLGPTRTLGFWKTHTEYTSSIFNNQLGGNIVLGDGITHQDPINSTAKLFGAWYSNISMKSTGKGKNAQRSAVDQARMQLAWQWLAAKLNCAAFGCSSATQTLLADASAAYAAGNITAMLNYAGQLDAYNNSGDTVIIGNAGKATPAASQSIANLSFWDTP